MTRVTGGEKKILARAIVVRVFTILVPSVYKCIVPRIVPIYIVR